MRRLLIVALASVLLLSVPAAALYWLCYTEAGLRWLVGQTARLTTVELQIDGLKGTLGGPLSAERVHIQHERIILTASNVRARLRLRSLLMQTVQVRVLEADAVTAALKPRTRPPRADKPRFLPVRWLTLRARSLRVGRARLTLPGGAALTGEEVEGQVRLSSQHADLQDLRVERLQFLGAEAPSSTGGPEITLLGAAQLRAADPIRLTGSLRWSVALDSPAQYSGQTRFEGDLARLEFTANLRAPQPAQFSGRLLDLTSDWRWEAQARASEFTLEPWRPETNLGAFDLALQGRGGGEALEIRAIIEPRTLSTGPMQIAFGGRYRRGVLYAERAQLTLPAHGARVEATGSLSFAAQMPAVQLSGQWSQLGWPLEDQLVRSARGRFTFEGNLPYTYTLQGTLAAPRTPALRFEGRGELTREQLSVRALRLAAGAHSTVDISGGLDFGAPKSWTFRADAREIDPALLLPEYPGRVSLRLEASGAGLTAHGPWTGQLIGLRGTLRGQPVSGHAEVSRAAQVWNIDSVLLQLGSARLQADGQFDERPGRQPDVRWQLAAGDLSDLLPEAAGALRFSGRLGGTHEAPELEATLEGRGLRYRDYRAESLTAASHLDLTSALGPELEPADAGRVQLTLQGRQLTFAGQKLAALEMALEGNTAGHTLRAEALAEDGRLELTVSGAYAPRQWQGQLEQLRVVFEETPLTLEAPAQVFAGAERLEIAPFCLVYTPQRICGHARAEGPPGTPWRELLLEGALRAHTRELGFIPALVPEIDRASGEFSAELTLAGTFGAPRIDGMLTLANGELDLYAVNLLLREVSLALALSGKSLSLTGAARAGEGHLAVDGRLEWAAGAPHGALALRGEKLLIADVPEARVEASPNISVTLDGREIQVEGAVRVPYARLSPANLTGAMLPSDDEIIVGAPQADPAQSFRITTGIHLILGEDVRVDTYGLSGRITGGIAAYTDPDEVSTATGELKIVEGKYAAYGRELDIERGRLIFTGGVLSNPGIDIRATRQFPEVLAGINVRGTLRDPRVSFFSEPPLPQTQVASLLVAGRTFDALQEGGGPGLGSEQLLAQGGALLARQLGGQLGIDDVSVESGANADTSLVLGKYLSPRLYVGYGISLAESINTLKLRYTLGDHWTIKLEAGEQRSADVVYAIER